MKRRLLPSLICATTIFLADLLAFDNLSPATNQVVVEAVPIYALRKITRGALQAIGLDGQSRHMSAPVEMPEGMSLELVFGASESAQKTIHESDEAHAFGFNEMGIWRHMSWALRVVWIALLILSAWSIAIMIERYVIFSAARNQSREFAPKVAASLMSRNIDQAIRLSDKYTKSHLATVVNAGLREFRAHQLLSDISVDVVGASKRALQRATAIKIAEFRRGLSVLASIRSTALFVGLLGTVFEIIDELEWVGESAWAGASAVAGGIAEGLATTAAGLAVSVPVAWLLNYFTNRVDHFLVEMNNSSAELIDFFLKEGGRK
jgi:biopolymer transport protein ExbB/biopolymer transport protein TolQ